MFGGRASDYSEVLNCLCFSRPLSFQTKFFLILLQLSHALKVSQKKKNRGPRGQGWYQWLERNEIAYLFAWADNYVRVGVRDRLKLNLIWTRSGDLTFQEIRRKFTFFSFLLSFSFSFFSFLPFKNRPTLPENIRLKFFIPVCTFTHPWLCNDKSMRKRIGHTNKDIFIYLAAGMWSSENFWTVQVYPVLLSGKKKERI